MGSSRSNMDNSNQNKVTKQKKPYLHLFLLVITAVIWGASFIAQKTGMEHIGPFTYNGVRMLLGGTILLPVIYFMRKTGHTSKIDMDELLEIRGVSHIEDLPWYDRRPQLYGGIFAGSMLFVASSLQQHGIQYTTTGKAGFITAMYVILVPVVGIFLRHKTRIADWLSVFLAVFGFYFLSITENITIAKGDLYLLLGAFCYSFHILIINHYSPIVDGVTLASTQFIVTGLLSIAPMFIFETPNLNAIKDAALPILYSGGLSSGVGFTLQVIGLQKVPPTQASLITSQESTLSVIFGWLILGEVMSGREILGCLLMLAGILISQLTPTKDYDKLHS